MVDLIELENYCNTLLTTREIKDYCPNGLQLQGCSQVKKIVSGVTASLAMIEAAKQANADLLLVHHGYFWKGENACITGIKYQRIKMLIESNMSVLAYHLPLDIHKKYGNNIQLAQHLGLQVEGCVDQSGLIFYGKLSVPCDAKALAVSISNLLARKVLHIETEKVTQIQRIAWCSGAAQNFIEQVVEQGFDAYLSGEVSEQTWHIAKEYGIHYYACGHHATERYGVQALGQHLADYFNIEHEFIDIYNPV